MNDRIEFVILHTNDLHSVFESMPRIRSFFEAYEREQPPERLLRFDIGDHMDRVRLETEGTMGEANIDIMNATGYDAAVPGNNEGLTFSAQTLETLYGRAAFKTVVANMRPAAGSAAAAWIRPRHVLVRDGIRFGIFGLTAAFNDFYKELGWEATDPYAAAREQVERLRREDAADVVVALSHLGLMHDRKLAETVPGIDLILGGHTHHLMAELERIGETYIGAAGKFGTHVGVARLHVDRRTRRVTQCVGGAEDVSAAKPDPAIARAIARHAASAAAAMNRVVARLPRPLDAAEDRESPLGNLLAIALRRHCDAEIGVVNAGQLLGGLASGDVTAAAVHAICPHPINPCAMLLRGASLRRAIEQSLDAERRGMTVRGFGFRGKVLGALCLDGVEVDVARAAGEAMRVSAVRVGGEPLDDDRLYRVGTIDMFTFKVGYESMAEGEQIVYHLPEFIRDLLAEALSSPMAEDWIADAERPRYRPAD